MATFLSYLKTNKIPKREKLISLLKKPYSRYGVFLYTLIIAILILFYSFLITINDKFLVVVPSHGGNINEGVIGSPKFINPVIENTETGKEINRIVYSGLVKKDINGQIVPELAESYSISPDGRTYTFTLKNKNFFSNGTPLTSSDVLFTVNKLKDPNINKDESVYWSNIIAEINQNTISFTLPSSDDSFLEHAAFGIISQKQWSKTTPENFEEQASNTIAIGAGPFSISSIKKTNGILNNVVLKKNKHYHDKNIYLDNITVFFFANQEDTVKALRNGTIDFTMSLSTENASNVAMDKNFISDKIPTNSTVSLFRSKSENLLSDTKFVSVLSDFIDRQRIIDNVDSGYGLSNQEMAPNSLEETLDKLKSLGYSYKEGVLEKGGNQIGFSIAVENDESMLETAKDLAENLGNLGMIVTVKAYNHGIFQDNLLANEYSIFLTTNSQSIIPANYEPVINIYTKATPFIKNKKVFINTPMKFDTPSDRYNDITHWYTKTQKVWKLFTTNNLLKKLI